MKIKINIDWEFSISIKPHGAIIHLFTRRYILLWRHDGRRILALYNDNRSNDPVFRLY